MYKSQVILLIPSLNARYSLHKDDVDEILRDHDLTRADATVLPFSEASATELAELIGSEMENANYHSMVDLAEDVLKELQEAGDFDESQQKRVMEALASAMGQFLG